MFASRLARYSVKARVSANAVRCFSASRLALSQSHPFAEHYEVLGVDVNAPISEVKKAYTKKAKELHPDVNPEASAKVEFQKVQEAWRILSEADKNPEIVSNAAKQAAKKTTIPTDFGTLSEAKKKELTELVVKLELRNLLIWLGIFTAITAILDQTIPYWPWEGGLKEHYKEHYEPLKEEYVEYKERNLSS